MPQYDVALLEWPADGAGGPRLLGRLTDADLVELVRERLAQARRRELARLEGRALRLVGPTDDDSAA